MRSKWAWIMVLMSQLYAGCGTAGKEESINDDEKSFEANIDGKQTKLYTIKNVQGLEASITSYGGRIVSLSVPDKNGEMTNVVIGFDSVVQYQGSTEPYFGATIGRYGNRIAGGKFSLDGVDYQISINNGPNALHGGKDGFQDKVWDAKLLNDSTLELSYLSKDGEERFPGSLNVKVTYSITADNGLQCEYEATTDKGTVVNLTNHAFFNLNGEGAGKIENHLLQIDADRYTPVDSTLIPTGKIEPVKDGPFDFTKLKRIGEHIEVPNEQIKFGKGYDHNFVLRGGGFRKVAMAKGEMSGIVMEVWTDQPGLQFYSGNFMQSQNVMRKGRDDFRTAFCLETQHFPDAPNQPAFKTTRLEPGQKYYTISKYKFFTL